VGASSRRWWWALLFAGACGRIDFEPLNDGDTSAARSRHVFVIVMTYATWDEVDTSSSTPYIHGTLLTSGAHAEAYVPVSGTFPDSEPYDLWLEAGDNLGSTIDQGPTTNRQTTTMHLTSLLGAAGFSWKTYQEGSPATDCPLSSISSTGYYEYHNPFVYFDDVTGNTATCVAHVRPLTELATDLANDTVPNYSFIVPSLCHDGHDSCAPENDPLLQVDHWLAMTVPQITASPAYQDDGVLFVLWDYSGSSDTSPIGLIAMGAHSRAGYASTVHYDASSTVRSVQTIFGVGPPLRNAATATDFADLFTQFP